MVKLKYTSRNISGVRAGEALKKDLKKRYPSSSTSAFRLRDPVLEIDISNRQLTDDGFKEFIVDLCYALKYSSAEHPNGANKLQELHLQGNLLSLEALVGLADVIKLSAQDLKELDISNNRINVITNSDVHKWEYFLKSFSQCCVLKKVNFSHNLLSSRGIEVLARVYIRSELDFVETEPEPDNGNKVVVLLDSRDPGTHSSSQGGKGSHKRGSQTNQTPVHKVHTDTEIRHFASTRGLRSVPYLIIQDVAMTNGGVIHLGEILKLHRIPEHLLSFLPYGKPPALPELDNALRGIYWLPNENLSPLSVKFMTLTSQLQESSAEREAEDGGELTDGLQDLGLDEEDSLHDLEHRQKQQKLNRELMRVTKLHRIDVLGSEGMLKSEIWHGALKMLAVARAILLDEKKRPPSAEEELQRKSVPDSHSRQPHPPPIRPPQNGDLPRSTNEFDTPRGVLISTFRFDPESSTFDLMFPAMHSTPENPVLEARPPPVGAAMSGYSSSLTRRPHQALVSSQQLRDIPTTVDGHSSRAKGATISETYRFSLPLRIWGNIISQATGVNRILHPDQQMRILSYASSWSALAAEVSINGAPEHQQLWKILDSIDCFSYKPLS